MENILKLNTKRKVTDKTEKIKNILKVEPYNVFRFPNIEGLDHIYYYYDKDYKIYKYENTNYKNYMRIQRIEYYLQHDAKNIVSSYINKYIDNNDILNNVEVKDEILGDYTLSKKEKYFIYYFTHTHNDGTKTIEVNNEDISKSFDYYLLGLFYDDNSNGFFNTTFIEKLINIICFMRENYNNYSGYNISSYQDWHNYFDDYLCSYINEFLENEDYIYAKDDEDYTNFISNIYNDLYKLYVNNEWLVEDINNNNIYLSNHSFIDNLSTYTTEEETDYNNLINTIYYWEEIEQEIRHINNLIKERNELINDGYNNIAYTTDIIYDGIEEWEEIEGLDNLYTLYKFFKDKTDEENNIEIKRYKINLNSIEDIVIYGNIIKSKLNMGYKYIYIAPNKTGTVFNKTYGLNEEQVRESSLNISPRFYPFSEGIYEIKDIINSEYDEEAEEYIIEEYEINIPNIFNIIGIKEKEYFRLDNTRFLDTWYELDGSPLEKTKYEVENTFYQLRNEDDENQLYINYYNTNYFKERNANWKLIKSIYDFNEWFRLTYDGYIHYIDFFSSELIEWNRSSQKYYNIYNFLNYLLTDSNTTIYTYKPLNDFTKLREDEIVGIKFAKNEGYDRIEIKNKNNYSKREKIGIAKDSTETLNDLKLKIDFVTIENGEYNIDDIIIDGEIEHIVENNNIILSNQLANAISYAYYGGYKLFDLDFNETGMTIYNDTYDFTYCLNINNDEDIDIGIYLINSKDISDLEKIQGEENL